MIENYKEILIRRTEETHLFFFKYNELQGVYVLDGDDKRWITCDLMKYQPNPIPTTKFFDFADNEQVKCFLVERKSKDEDFQFVLNMIYSNKRQGTPRRFINFEGEKVNIEFPCE